MDHSHIIKVKKYEAHCVSEGMELLPLSVDTFGGWHKVALETQAKLGPQLNRVMGGTRVRRSDTSDRG